MRRAAAWPTRKPPKQPRRQHRSKSSGVISRIPPRSKTPALKTTRLGSPSSRSTVPNSFATSGGCVALQASNRTPSFDSALASGSSSRSRAAATTACRPARNAPSGPAARARHRRPPRLLCMRVLRLFRASPRRGPDESVNPPKKLRSKLQEYTGNPAASSSWSACSSFSTANLRLNGVTAYSTRGGTSA
jgi:hypothetical protein